MSKVISHKNWNLGLIGGGRGVAKKTDDILRHHFPGLKIAFVLDGDEASNYLYQRMDRSKQRTDKEEFIHRLAKERTPLIDFKVAMGVGGAFDYLSGILPRASTWMRKLGLEWLFRLISEPRKRAKRVFNAVVVFPSLVIYERLKSRKFF